jgi:hypothetical protein
LLDPRTSAPSQGAAVAMLTGGESVSIPKWTILKPSWQAWVNVPSTLLGMKVPNYLYILIPPLNTTGRWGKGGWTRSK